MVLWWWRLDVRKNEKVRKKERNLKDERKVCLLDSNEVKGPTLSLARERVFILIT